MKRVTDKGTVSKAYGQTLEAPITFDYDYDEYESFVEVQTAKDELSEKEVVNVRNAERRNNARQKAQVVALDAAGYKKPNLETDEQLRLREMFKVLMSSKRYTEADARALASSTLGIEWAK